MLRCWVEGSSDLFCFCLEIPQFDVSSIPENDSSLKRFGRVEGGNIATQTRFSVLEDFEKLGENDFLSSDLKLYQDKVVGKRQEQLISDFQGSDDVYHDVVAQPSQSLVDDITKFASFQCGNSEVLEPEKETPFSSLRILKDFPSRSRHMNGRKINAPSYDRACTRVSDPKSTIAIISLAGEKFIQCFSQRVDDLSLLSNPFAFSFMGLSGEESRDVELVHDLLACAEKVGQQQFDSASKLITQCDKLSSNKGNPVQRLTYYFSAALREKINQETGGLKYDGSGKKQLVDLREYVMCVNPSIVALHQKVPFAQVCQFTSIQTIAENIRGARKFHIIDMEIRNGVQYTILMQLLAARGENILQYLKITAIGTRSKSKIEETGKRLMSVAQSMNVPLTFNLVMVADMLDLNIDALELDDMEDCAIYSAYFLTSLILQPDHLDHLIRVFRNINPCVIVVSEFEANHTSPAFVTRFIESLFYYGAYFDALADCMADVESNRRDIEADFGLMIKNIVAAEGTERIVRHVTLDVWRAYFARFGLVEADLSSVSEYQADLLVKSFKCGSSCSVDMDGKCLVVGWKGAPIYSVSAWRFLVPENDSSLKSIESMEGESLKKQSWFSELENPEFGEIDSFSSDPKLLGSKAEHEQQVQLFRGLDDSYLNVVSRPLQSCHQDIEKFASVQSKTSEIFELEKEITDSFPYAALGIVNITKRSRRMDGKKINLLSYERSYTKVSSPRLSTTAIIRLAGEKFIQSCSGRVVHDLSQLSNPFACYFMGLSDRESRDVQLVQDLLACAEKVGRQQFDSASKFISQFDKLSFTNGNPVQRLVYYFADALREKIKRERGHKHIGLGKKQITELQEALMSPNPGIIAFHQRVPFSQVCQFTAVQTIVENVREARKVHIIDFEIRNGMQWTILMEALANQCPYSLQHLKITAVCTRSKSKMEETGKRLKNFAQSMNLPFSFNVIMVANMLDLNIDLFELNDEEEVAVYLAYFLSTLIAQPGHLDSLMRVIKNINPCVTVISEVEANHNSPAFVNRFIEALFYYSAFFDSLADCMADDEPNRKISEGHFSLAIRNIVAAEGAERIFRHISMDVWMAFLARFGLAEMELSAASRYQADLLVQKSDCGSSCTLDLDRKSMIIGWKGEPIFSVSAWTFL